MIFWILIVLVVLVPVIIYQVHSFKMRKQLGVSTSFKDVLKDFDLISLEIVGYFMIYSSIIGAFIFSMTALLLPYSVSEEVEVIDLKAVGSSVGASGTFFLGFGEIDGHQRISYISSTGEDGKFVLNSERADKSTIVEDDTVTPHLSVIVSTKEHSWFAPFPVWSKSEYEFYVPVDSVSSDFGVTP